MRERGLVQTRNRPDKTSLRSVGHQIEGEGNVSNQQTLGLVESTQAHKLAQTRRLGDKQRTDGGNISGVEIVLSETNDQTCFSHSAVSDEQQLEKEIVLFGHARSWSPTLRKSRRLDENFSSTSVSSERMDVEQRGQKGGYSMKRVDPLSFFSPALSCHR